MFIHIDVYLPQGIPTTRIERKVGRGNPPNKDLHNPMTNVRQYGITMAIIPNIYLALLFELATSFVSPRNCKHQ